MRNVRADGMSKWIVESIRVIEGLDLGRKALPKYSLYYIMLLILLYNINRTEIGKFYHYKTLLKNEKKLIILLTLWNSH